MLKQTIPVPPVIHTESDESVREAVGLFENMDDLQEAVRALEGTAFPRHDISILGGRKDIEEEFGQPAIVPEVAEDDPSSPRRAPVRPEEITIGTSALVGGSAYIGAVALALGAGAFAVPATITAAAIGGAAGGALIGTILARIFGHQYDRHIEEQIEKGGLLLWVRTPDAEREKIACDILRAHNAHHVHVHTVK